MDDIKYARLHIISCSCFFLSWLLLLQSKGVARQVARNAGRNLQMAAEVSSARVRVLKDRSLCSILVQDVVYHPPGGL